jgi:hypothetical protein
VERGIDAVGPHTGSVEHSPIVSVSAVGGAV